MLDNLPEELARFPADRVVLKLTDLKLVAHTAMSITNKIHTSEKVEDIVGNVLKTAKL